MSLLPRTPANYWGKTMPKYMQISSEAIEENPWQPCNLNSPRFSKKIGMNLGIEYLVRSGLIREFMVCPCSIFVKSKDSKIVITINKANIQDNEHCIKYSVRNWFVSSCDEQQPIPSMEEVIVRDVDLYHHPKVILSGFSPIHFDCSSIEWKRNRGNNGSPMSKCIYEDYFYKMFTPIAHSVKREEFLWNNFTNAYVPAIDHIVVDEGIRNSWTEPYRSKRKLRTPSYLGQQKLIERNFKNIWYAWLKWKKFMLFDTVPGELIFMRDYASLS